VECEDITCGRRVSVNGNGARVIDSFVRNKEIGEVCFEGSIAIMALYVTPEGITIVVVGISDRERRDGKRNEEEVRRGACQSRSQQVSLWREGDRRKENVTERSCKAVTTRAEASFHLWLHSCSRHGCNRRYPKQQYRSAAAGHQV
jgi:hypothetical protein